MNERNVGTIVQVVGPVLDIKFADGHLPNLNNAIHIEHNGKTMTAEEVVDEILEEAEETEEIAEE